MVKVAHRIGQPPVGSERGVEKRPHAEDGSQGKEDAPVTHGKRPPSSGYKFESRANEPNQWNSSRNQPPGPSGDRARGASGRRRPEPWAGVDEPASSSSPGSYGSCQHEVDQVPHLGLVDQARIVGRHLGARDALGNSPVDVDGPPASLVDPAIEIGGAQGIAPFIELLTPKVLHGLVQGIDSLLPLAGVAAEDDVIEDVLGNETLAITLGQNAVAIGADQLRLLDPAQEQVSAAEECFPAKTGVRGVVGFMTCVLGRLPLVEDAFGRLADRRRSTER